MNTSRSSETSPARPGTAPAVTLRRVEVRGRGRIHSKPSFDGKYFSDVDRETDNLIIRELATGKERILTKNSKTSEPVPSEI